MALTDVAIVSACYGDFDTPTTQAAQDVPVDWIYFTDGQKAPDPWQTVKGVGLADGRMAAKWFKCEPPVSQRYAIWIDANTETTSPSFAREALASIHDGLAVFRHPRRDCIYDEAEASIGKEGQDGKYAGMPIMEQVAHYREEGHPERAGLFACGTVAWDLAHSGIVGRDWLAECEKWTPQDQLSLPVVCRRLGITPGVFGHRQIERRTDRAFGNRWQIIHPHR